MKKPSPPKTPKGKTNSVGLPIAQFDLTGKSSSKASPKASKGKSKK